MPVDKRCEEQRIDIARPVELLDPDVGLGVTGYTKNLSPSGMRARLDLAPTLGNNLQLAIDLADGTSPLKTQGEVIWCLPDSQGGGAEVGLRFSSNPDPSPMDLSPVAEHFLPEAQTIRLGQQLKLDTVEQIIDVCVEEIVQDESLPEGTIQLNLSVNKRRTVEHQKHDQETDDDLLSSAEIWKPHPFRDLRAWFQKYLGPLFIVAIAIGTPIVKVLAKGIHKCFLLLPGKTRLALQNLFQRLNLTGRIHKGAQKWHVFHTRLGEKIAASRNHPPAN